MASEKSKILVIGGTGHIGKLIIEASVKAGHSTLALVREASLSDPNKGKTVQNFKDLGVTILHGDFVAILTYHNLCFTFRGFNLGFTIPTDLNDHESLVKAIKQTDVVISTVGSMQIFDQTKIISAIKEAGNVKRFFPSEFGMDVDRTSAVEPAKSAFAGKLQTRRTIEAEGIPYTYLVTNYFAGYYLPTLVQLEPGLTSPPKDKVKIFGDGNAKAVINKEEDIAAYTIKTVDDPRTLNKTLYISPPNNTLSMNEIVTLWEEKIGKSLEKIYMSEEQIFKSIQESPVPFNVLLSINHAVFVKGDQTNFTIEPSFGFEASELYPDIKYTSVDEYLSYFA